MMKELVAARLGDADLVRGYRAQHHVEIAFCQLKDTGCVVIRPQSHRAYQKIEVHVVCCVLALCTLLQRELSRDGVDLSVPALSQSSGDPRRRRPVSAA